MGSAAMETSAWLSSWVWTHVGEVHAVELVAGEDEHVVDAGLLDVPQVLPHGVGGALIPAGVVERLLGGKDFHEAAVEGVEDVGAADVLVQAGGVELREDVDAVQAAIDAVGDGDVDEAVLARHRHGRLGADLGEGIEPRALSAAEDQSDDVSHTGSPSAAE